MQTPVYAEHEAIEDDVHAVRKRRTSRLWYRNRVAPQPVATAPGLSRPLLRAPTAGRTAGTATAAVSISAQRGIA